MLADEPPKKKKRGGKKRERQFLTELRHSFEDRGAFFYKLPDMPHFAGAGFRFDLDKPFDAFVVYSRRFGAKGIPIAIEAKSLRRYAALGSQIRPSQIKGLNGITAAGGRGFIFLNVRSNTPRMNRLLILDWSLFGEDFTKGKTIKKKDLQRMPFIEGQRINKKIRYDLSPWLTTLK